MRAFGNLFVVDAKDFSELASVEENVQLHGMRLFLLGWLSVCVTINASFAQTPLKKELNHVYSQWRRAMLSKDYKAWKQWTSYARQMETRNAVVSQKKSFPKAVFAVPMRPPAVTALKPLALNVKGPTATAIYFGKVDFGVGGQVPDGLLLLNYLKEGNTWKFYTLTLMNQLPANVRAQARAGNTKFLNDAEFRPSGVAPRLQKACPKPDYVSDIHIISLGFDTEVIVNGISYHGVANDYGTELVIGGLKKGANKIQVKSRRLGKSVSGEHRLKVTAHVKTGNRAKPAIKVFEFTPADPKRGPFNFNGTFNVDRKALRNR